MNRYEKQRAELVRNSKALIAERERTNTNLSEDDRAYLKAKADEVDALDAKIDAMKADAPLVDAFKASQPGPETPGSQGDGSAVTGGSKSIVGIDTARKVTEGLVDGTKSVAMTGSGTSDLMLGIRAVPDRPLDFLATVPVQRVASPPTFHYVRSGESVMNAAVTPAGETKPESDLNLSEVSGELAVVAHVISKIPKYLLQDVAGLHQFISRQMTHGLWSAVEGLLLNGDGPIEGVFNTSGVITQDYEQDLAFTIRSAVTQLEAAGYRPNAVALSPADWQALETSQASGSGEYHFDASPVSRSARTIWGVPVVTSTALPAGKALMTSAESLSLLTDGQVATDLDKSQGFTTNEIALRVETRVAPAIWTPSGVVSIDTAE